MADYARSECTVSYGSTSALVDPDLDRLLTSTPASPTNYKHIKVPVGTSEETIDLSEFATIQELYIKNHDSTNYVLAKGRVLVASKTFTANKLGFTATAPCTITDDDSTFLSALYFKAGDYAVVTSATEAANSGTFLVQAAVAGTLTVAETVAFTLDADDAGTPTIKNHSPFTERVNGADAGWCKLTNVTPGDDLILIANTAACTVEIIVIGT